MGLDSFWCGAGLSTGKCATQIYGKRVWCESPKSSNCCPSNFLLPIRFHDEEFDDRMTYIHSELTEVQEWDNYRQTGARGRTVFLKCVYS